MFFVSNIKCLDQLSSDIEVEVVKCIQVQTKFDNYECGEYCYHSVKYTRV